MSSKKRSSPQEETLPTHEEMMEEGAVSLEEPVSKRSKKEDKASVSLDTSAPSNAKIKRVQEQLELLEVKIKYKKQELENLRRAASVQ